MRGRKRLGKVSDSQWVVRGVEEVGEVGDAQVVETEVNGVLKERSPSSFLSYHIID